jgi:hypothetical protein
MTGCCVTVALVAHPEKSASTVTRASRPARLRTFDHHNSFAFLDRIAQFPISFI